MTETGAPSRPRRLGLTGNIACGKSTVLRMLAERGAEVVDADRLVHGLLGAPGPAVDAIAARFGLAVLQADGTVNRAALGQIVFRDPAALADLEALLHPTVTAEVWRRATATTAPVFVVDAIKLIESGIAAACDAVWTVDCQREQQIDRLIRTRGMTRAEAIVRIDAQPPAADKRRLADVTIDNSGDLVDTERQVEAAWQAFIAAPLRAVALPIPAPG